MTAQELPTVPSPPPEPPRNIFQLDFFVQGEINVGDWSLLKHPVNPGLAGAVDRNRAKRRAFGTSQNSVHLTDIRREAGKKIELSVPPVSEAVPLWTLNQSAPRAVFNPIQCPNFRWSWRSQTGKPATSYLRRPAAKHSA